jgi:hypothetical protein
MVPDGFQSALRGKIPMIFDRLSAEMTHQPDVPEAIVAVLKDFLIRWGSTFERFEDYHDVYLHELCDRHVQRFNTGNGVPVSHNGNGRLNGPPLKRDLVQSAKFLSAVLVAVEQEMRGQVRSMLNVEVIPLSIKSPIPATA